MEDRCLIIQFSKGLISTNNRPLDLMSLEHHYRAESDAE